MRRRVLRSASELPPLRTHPNPPLLMATTSDPGLKCAAANSLALQHYFATPVSARVALEDRYRDMCNDTAPDHLHSVIATVHDAPDARERLEAALRQSFREGEHPHVPQAPERHLGPDGTPNGPDAMAKMVAEGAIIGSVGQVVDELGDFICDTGARRIAVYHEAIGDAATTLESLESFAEYVIPQLAPGL